MKRVLLGRTQFGEAKGKVADLLMQFLRTPPSGRGLDLMLLRQRVKLMDMLEAAADSPYIDLEDAPYQSLREALEQAQFLYADRELLRVIDAVLDAKEPPPVKLVESEPEVVEPKHVPFEQNVANMPRTEMRKLAGE